jgi:DNA-directed RNA polymerase specialized sigma24 family protein
MPGQSVNVLEVDEALRKLEQQDPQKTELVRLRFFAALTLADAARALEISRGQLRTTTGLMPGHGCGWK